MIKKFIDKLLAGGRGPQSPVRQAPGSGPEEHGIDPRWSTNAR